MATQIVLLEDDPGVAELVKEELSGSGYQVTHISDGNVGWSDILDIGPDLIIADIMLPGRDGLSLVGEWRRVGCRVPILFLTAKSAVADRVAGLEIGADDYLTKPFALTELMARVKALLRRADQGQEEETGLTVGELSLDLLSRELSLRGQVVALSNKDFELLAFLMRHPGEIVSKRMILEQVWHYNFHPGTNIVEVRIAALRKLLDQPGEPSTIETVRGVGYRLTSR